MAARESHAREQDTEIHEHRRCFGEGGEGFGELRGERSSAREIPLGAFVELLDGDRADHVLDIDEVIRLVRWLLVDYAWCVVGLTWRGAQWPAPCDERCDLQ